MAAHRRPRWRATNGASARTAATLALAGAATATGWNGTGHAAPEPSPAQVEATVDRLYREAEAATEKYSGAEEQADAAARRLADPRDETAREEERLDVARDALGSVAAAQYRGGGLDPAPRLALSAGPDRYLDSAARAERAGSRHATAVARAQRRLREIERAARGGTGGGGLAGVPAGGAETARRRPHRQPHRGPAAAGPADRHRTRRARPHPGPRRPVGRRPRGPVRSDRDPNPRAAAAVAYAYGKLGNPHVWGATGPNAFDCSGLVQAAYRSAGVSPPRTSYARFGAGRRVPRSELRPATWSSSTPLSATSASTWAVAA
ncbi:cell wall-associated NlpC family hydrolase [Streptomyces griseoviridis]|uniref:Cell wall-associated NlpC family hydrolase n=1 Tax=Streptomyces griseoviridis TaxID=45398 RepID=A0ABT9LIU5_STRGD|nr:cell wall-associated NlpC family hydrolase [Streptomyces griseoviridis]GGS93591.1 hypothetical protein GCM10010240_28710 [Streptomyces griseoviridis]